MSGKSSVNFSRNFAGTFALGAQVGGCGVEYSVKLSGKFGGNLLHFSL